jgi:membrane protein DedA with SNARE-associated domain
MFTALAGSFLHSYGYLAIVILVGLECVGIPLPGESTLIAAALYAGSTHRLNIAVIAAVAAAAAIAGDNLGYAAGYAGGTPLLKRYGRYVHLTDRRLAVGRYLFRHYGGRVVFVGRFVSVLRTYAAFLAGVNRMPWRRFLACNAAGGVLWALAYSFGAYLLGNAARGLGSTVTIVGLVATVVVTVVTALLIRRRFAQLESKAVAEEAGLAGASGDPPERVPERAMRANSPGPWRPGFRDCAVSGPDQAGLVSVDDGVGSVAQGELGQDPRDVRLHRGLADH